MMSRKIKYGKIAVVIFLTVLIWVWADLALDEILPDRPATIVVDESANPKLWVSFSQALSADIKITLSGPHAAIADVSRKLRKGGGIEFNFDAAQEKMEKPDDYSLNLLAFLQKDKEIKRLGLKVESCEPEILDVNVVELVEKSLTVECFDEDGIPLDVESIEPSKVKILALEEMRTARVQLSRSEISQARDSPIKKTPYIDLTGGQTREAETPVEITMAEDVLKDYTITTATLGFTLSDNLQGKYKVEVDNLSAVISSVAIKATLEAKQAYENMPYQVILEIDDEDARSTEPLRREVVYNFPEEFVRKDEITLNQTPIPARFKLVALSPESP